ncbi:MAG TPA: hypothetical protein VFK11_01190 [Candidatus Saccharimonadales bacterium]|nr:hypothetical protein [Candidatus Saccharimonadales bacterium]
MEKNNDNHDKKLSLEALGHSQDKIIALLHEEQKRAKEKFPLTYALLATFGVACVFAGINRIIVKIDLLNNHPITLVVVGLAILLITGAAYKKLG